MLYSRERGQAILVHRCEYCYKPATTMYLLFVPFLNKCVCRGYPVAALSLHARWLRGNNFFLNSQIPSSKEPNSNLVWGLRCHKWMKLCRVMCKSLFCMWEGYKKIDKGVDCVIINCHSHFSCPPSIRFI